MVRGLANHLSVRHRHLHSPVGEIILRGRAVIGEKHSVALSGRDRSLLDVLALHSGTVVSPATLLRLAWRDERCDPHVVQTAIGRLRRRLAPTGLAVVTRTRRGYLLDAQAGPCPVVAESVDGASGSTGSG